LNDIATNQAIMVFVFTATETTVTRPDLTIPLKSELAPITLRHSHVSNGEVVPIVPKTGSKVDFGAEVYGIDLNDFSDADFDFISDAIHKHKLLVFKQQPAMLSPQQQYKLTSR
jgi:alpha-ketoglutarate-dependent taurine dioxygenase